jgi:hypothetical protein
MEMNVCQDRKAFTVRKPFNKVNKPSCQVNQIQLATLQAYKKLLHVPEHLSLCDVITIQSKKGYVTCEQFWNKIEIRFYTCQQSKFLADLLNITHLLDTDPT